METVECLKKISSKIVQYSTVTQMKLLTTTLRIYNNDSFYLFIYFTCSTRYGIILVLILVFWYFRFFITVLDHYVQYFHTAAPRISTILLYTHERRITTFYSMVWFFGP